jgi:hypothetical protein
VFNKYKTFSALIYSYINKSGNWQNEKLCGNMTPEGRSVFTQFRVFTIPTSVDITVYQYLTRTQSSITIYIDQWTEVCVHAPLFCLILIWGTGYESDFEGRPRKIRNLKYGGEKIKNKEGSETAEHVMGYWPMTMRISNFVIWPCSLTKNMKNCQIWNISKLELICIVARQQLRMLDTKYSINNSWRKFKRKECLINVCKSIG